jgi:hypothetical protein
MADTQILNPGCEDVDDDCDEERGKRGKRGKRGHRGHRGPEGPAGPAGPSSGALIGRQVFDVAGTFTYVPTPGTRAAIVRGAGGGGGGGGVGASGGPNDAAGASGGNSGTSIETEVKAPAGTFLTGGPVTVGAGAPGMVGNGAPQNGGNSTLVIGGVTLVAPGGMGGQTGGFGFLVPNVIPSPAANAPVVGVDYQAFDLGAPGFANSTNNVAIAPGNGGSGDYGSGGGGNSVGAGDGLAAGGNGAGGGGAAQIGGSAVVRTGGAGSPGIWIIEEYS